MLRDLIMNTFSKARRLFLKLCASASASALTTTISASAATAQSGPFRYSLAQWSLHRGFQNGKYKPLDFAKIARGQFGLTAVEYVNQFYADTLSDKLVRELHKIATGEGVQSLLIMVDREGALGDPDPAKRKQSVDNHHKWADAAHTLGCHSIRVNAQSAGSYDEQMKAAADGLNQLAEYCAKLNLNVLVENHGGLSSNGQWLTGVMKLADNPRVGTLPDFGNFTIDRERGEKYDKYLGVKELMPYAKAVSAKSYHFDKNGIETEIDYFRMLKIIHAAGYRDWIGIEYEGEKIGEEEGIKLTLQLLRKAEKKIGEELINLQG